MTCPASSPAVVLLSGGLDSTTALAATLAQGVTVPAAVFVDYGQRHIRERDAAIQIAGHYRVPLLCLDLSGFGALVSSALTGGDLATTIVPNRNAVLAAAAAGIAVDQNAHRVVLATHAGDAVTYPDCRPEFVAALSNALRLGCGVVIEAPFLGLSKAEVVAEAARLGTPMHFTWSCYVGGSQHCGQCRACTDRAEAFRDAAVPDPTAYAATGAAR
jgi:7-cyano-7-deazaguanine synthase